MPLYRKYRPQNFGDLVGQEVISTALCNAIEMGKISHAYLFTGSRGTGKTSAARILAKSLNCIEGPTKTPCGKCPNCIDITNGHALDVLELDAASNTGVDNMRDIIDKTQFVPVSGKYKIFVIDEVHMLSPSAFNALLKTLEEPPKNLVFILATTESHKVLETIVSRCQRFDFRKIKTKDISNRLEYIAKLEKINVSKDAIELIALKSSGGLRDAIALLDQASVLGLGGNEISIDDVLSISGAVSQDDLFAITTALAKKQPDVLIELINKIINQGNEPLLILKELVSYFRNLLLVKTASNTAKINDLLAISDKALEQLKSQSQDFETIEIAQIIEKLAEYEVMLKNTTNQMLWIEVILISILHRQDIKVIKDLEKRVSSLEARFSGQNTGTAQTIVKPQPVITPVQEIPKVVTEVKTQEKSEPVKQESATVIQPATTQDKQPSEDVKQEWVNILNLMDSFPAKNYFLTVQLVKPVKISDSNIIIALKDETFIKSTKESKKLNELEVAVTKYFGKEVKIDLITFEENKNIKKKLKSSSEEKITPIEPKEISPQIEHETIESEQIEQNFDIEIEELQEIKVLKEPVKASKKKFSDETEMIMDLFQGKIID